VSKSYHVMRWSYDYSPLVNFKNPNGDDMPYEPALCNCIQNFRW
jgi:hypothetical protein